MRNSQQHYENLIIGFGKGGKTLAPYLANYVRWMPVHYSAKLFLVIS